VFNQDEDVEAYEHTLSIMSSLLENSPSFWLEQFIRLGISEKIERLVSKVGQPIGSGIGQQQTKQSPASSSIEHVLSVSVPPISTASLVMHLSGLERKLHCIH